MDLSKLPKLSKTTTPTNDDAPPAAEPARYRERDSGRYEDEGPLAAALDIFLAVGMGLLFIFLGNDYAKYLFNVGDPFPMPAAITGTGYVWKEGSPKAGTEVAPEDLQEPYKTEYQQKLKGHDEAIVVRNTTIVGQASLFFVGAALLIAGVLMIVAHIPPLPPIVRKGSAALGAAATALALLYAGYAIVVMLRTGLMPVLTMVALLVGGLSLFMQAAAVRSIGGGASRPSPRRDPDRPAAGYRPAAAVVAGPPGSPARTAHHRFAHQALRKSVFDNPAGAIGALQGPGGRLFLAELWASVSEDVGLADHVNPPAGLEAEMTQVGPYSAVIVTMPPARREGEAHFIGIVLRSYVRQDGAVIERQPLVLYYALEVPGDSPGGSFPGVGTDGAAALCEWQAGDHVRFGDRVKPDFHAFREAMRLKVQARQEAEDRVR